MSNVDPGGGDDGERGDLIAGQSTPNLSTLQESFSQQQVCHMAFIADTQILKTSETNIFDIYTCVFDFRQKYRP